MDFKSLKKNQKDLVVGWLKQDYVAHYWYGEGLKTTLESIEEFISGKKTMFDHWIAYDNTTPFGYLMTSPVDLKTEPFFSKHCDEHSVAVTLDLLIGDQNYLGKGLAHLMIKELLEQKFPNITDIFIDPSSNNTKAIRVYEKAGFKKIHEFNPEWDPSSTHLLMRLKTGKSAFNLK